MNTCEMAATQKNKPPVVLGPATSGPKGLPNRIRYARENAKLTQAEFARKCGVQVRQVGRWEKGTNLARPDQLAVIANAGDVHLFWLLTGVGDPDDQFRAEGRPVYDTLREFLEQRGDQVSDRERKYLTSQNLGDVDIGSKDFWSTMLTIYRAQSTGAIVRVSSDVENALDKISGRKKSGAISPRSSKQPTPLRQ